MNYNKLKKVTFTFILLMTIGIFMFVYTFKERDHLPTVIVGNRIRKKGAGFDAFINGSLIPNYLPKAVPYTETATANWIRKREADFDAFMNGRLIPNQFKDSDLLKQWTMDFEGEDVFVHLHIQKTGGTTFERTLIRNLDLKHPCKCKGKGRFRTRKIYTCVSPNNRTWLMSERSTGWVCGTHNDWTELQDCADKWFIKHDVASRTHRRYHYLSFIRNPVDRFFSEWQHVSRGATWKASRLHCNGRRASIEEVPFCFTNEDWSGVSFEEFISCEHNLAFNRMSRMLANLSKVNCYNNSHLDQKQVEVTLINSAKENLLGLAFFGLTENQKASEFLFEKTFGIKYIKTITQDIKTHVHNITITPQMRASVIETNKRDIYLYQFAKDLFLQRVKAMEKYLGYTVDEYFDHVRGK